MMISQFARESGLSVDTVRFYVRRGLLHPNVGQKGGARPYQMFSTADLEKARIIRIWQALGLTLEEINSVLRKQAGDEMAPSELLALLGDQRARLKRKIAELQKLVSFLDAKMTWLGNPTGDAPPRFPLTAGARDDRPHPRAQDGSQSAPPFVSASEVRRNERRTDVGDQQTIETNS